MADPDLEPLAARLEQSGDYRVLRRVPEVARYADDDPTAIKRLGLIVDIETTGLDPASDRIIELACLPFHFSPDGVLYDVLPGYAGFEDPGQPLSDEVIQLTGITDDQLRG
jgi:DNA polymerase III subunit epsilon